MNLVNQSLIKYVIIPIIWISAFVLLMNMTNIQWYIAFICAFALIQVSNFVFNLLLVRYGIAFPTEVIYYVYDEDSEKKHNIISIIVSVLCIIIFICLWSITKYSIVLCCIIACIVVLAIIHSNLFYFAIYGEPLDFLRNAVYTILNIVLIFVVLNYLYLYFTFALLGLLISVAIYVYLFVRILLKYIYKLDDDEEDERYKL